MRLPLQVGTSCLWAIARAAMTVVPGGVLIGIAVMAWGGEADRDGVGAFVVGLSMLSYGAHSVARAWRTRPSDASLGQEAIEIEGGVQDRLRLAWSDLDPQRTQTTPDDDEHRLRLVTKDGTAIAIAEADDAGEQRSLEALRESIAAKLGRNEVVAPQLPPEVIGCPGCGAPVPPDDAASVQCAFCRCAVPTPTAIRERTRAAKTVRQGQREIDATVADLLQQPSATWAATSLWVVSVIAAAVWVPVLAGLFAVGLSAAGGFEVGWAFVTGALGALVVVVLGRAALASRRALRVLAAGFGARAPDQAGGAPGCRRCGAPLPASEGIVVGCVFCNADNVLGIDVRRHVRPIQAHALSLREVVASRDAERRRWRLIALGMVPVTALAATMAITSLVVGHEHRQRQRQCESGVAQACYDLYVDFQLGIAVGEDDARALPYAERACALDHGEACFDLAQALFFGWDVAEDPARGEALRRRACALGHAPACAPLSS